MLLSLYMNTQKGFVPILILLAIAFGAAVLGGGTYLATHQQSILENILSNTKNTSSTDAEVSSVVSDDQVIHVESPSEGSILSENQKTIVRWTIPTQIATSFPADFDLDLFLSAQNKDNSSVSAPINDGNNFFAGSAEWNIPGYISTGQLKPGTYKIVWYLQAVPKDQARLCAVHTGKDCAPSVTDTAVISRGAQIKGESGWFTIGAAPSSQSIDANVYEGAYDSTLEKSHGVASIAKIPEVTDFTLRTPFHTTTASGRLSLSYAGVKFVPLEGLSKSTAESVCFESLADRCLFEGGEISANSRPVTVGLKILSPISGATVLTTDHVIINVKDGGPVGEYHAYLAHHADQDGHVDQVYEAHLTSVSGTNPYDFKWDLRNVSLDGDVFLTFSSFPAGRYSLIMVNKNTAASASTSITIKDGRSKYPLVKPYTEGTPLYNDVTWDGRGILMDGGGGTDTLSLVGKRSEYAIYHGKDMSDKNQYNTIVARQNVSGAIIVAVNTEILKFDDITLSIPQLTPIAR